MIVAEWSLLKEIYFFEKMEQSNFLPYKTVVAGYHYTISYALQPL